MGVVEGRDVGRIEEYGVAVNIGDRIRDFKRVDGGELASRVNEGLIVTGGIGSRAISILIKSVGAWIGTEVEIEGTIFLEEDENVLDFLL